MLIKYSEGSIPIQFKRGGHTYQSAPEYFRAGKKTNGKSIRTNYQLSKMQLMMLVTRAWRNISSSSKNDWQSWVDFLPQRSNKFDYKFLAAYQNFTKRNYYILLTEGMDAPLMLSPALVAYDYCALVISSSYVSGRTSLNFNFSRNDSSLIFNIFCTIAPSNSIKAPGRNELYLLSLPNNSGSIDITDLFFDRFGFYPQENDELLLSFNSCGVDNGQFFPPEIQRSRVTPIPPTKYGYLYPESIVTDIRNFCPVGWSFPSLQQFTDLRLYLDPGSSPYSNLLGKHIKETGSIYWQPDNIADNSAAFFARGAGQINALGVFNALRINCALWSSSDFQGVHRILVLSNAASGIMALAESNFSYSIRLIKNDSNPISEFIGNDGRSYPVITIGSQIWMAENSQETMFRNGNPIPLVQNATEYINRSGSCRAAPNYDQSLV